MPRVFRCSRTGLYYPSDYVENWGRKYGIGLGPVPISEALTNQYEETVAESDDMSKSMHPVGVSRAQIDCVDVSDEEYENNKAILAIDDPKMHQRSTIMRDKQLQKSRKMQSMFPGEVNEAAARIAARSRRD